MPKVNNAPLTIKYLTRIAAAMYLEMQGYMWAERHISSRIQGFDETDLINLEKMYQKMGTLRARGIAQYVRTYRLQQRKAS